MSKTKTAPAAQEQRKRLRTALEFTADEQAAVYQAAFASGVYRVAFYSAGVKYLASLPPEERRRIVSEYIAQADQSGEVDD